MESLSRISSLLETARDLTLEAAQAASVTGRVGSRGPPKQASAQETRKLLNSRADREVLDGLRKVIALMSRGTDCSEFFADVVKNVASPTLEIKKLVYIYLLQYAESEPDLALLSINTIQKALNDQNQLVRAMAIRVMSGIRVPVISQIVALGIKKCVSDMSAYVRKSAAVAIPKCYNLDPSTLPQLTEYLGVLLGDRSFYVVGAAVMAYQEVCPDRWDLLHPHYRSLVKMLIDMDEWGQLALLRVLTVYARRTFPMKPQKKQVRSAKANEKDETDFYAENGNGATKTSYDADLEMLLKSCLPLLQSRNSAVIVAVARVYRHLAAPDSLSTVVGPLISLLRAPLDVQHLALINIVSIALEHAQIFSSFVTHFLVNASDPPYIWRLKIEALSLIFPHATAHNQSLILFELEYFAKGYDKGLVKESVKAIGRCAQAKSKNASRCLRVLLRQVDSSDGTLVDESLTVIRHIIQQNPAAHANTVIQLAKTLDVVTNPSARASIIWLVGEFAGVEQEKNIAADTLRLLAKDFPDESEAAKLQIVLLAAKVYTHHLNKKQHGSAGTSKGKEVAKNPDEEEEENQENQHPIALLYSYVMLLARYDQSYDLRDRARMFKALLADPTSTQLATLVLLAPKPTPHAPSPSAGREKFTLGSASMVLGGDESLSGYEPLPEWVSPSRAPSPSLRNPPASQDAPAKGTGVGSMGIVAGQSSDVRMGSPRITGQEAPAPVRAGASNVVESLEDFLATDSESEEEETDDDDEEEESESGEGEEEEEDSEEEEEEESEQEEEAESAKLLLKTDA